MRISDTNDHESIVHSIERLAALGFHHEGTGGGCTALIRHDGDSEELITVDDGEAEAPTSADQKVCVGYWEDGDYVAGVSGFTLADCLAALENPSDEYHRLDLRLANDFHRVR